MPIREKTMQFGSDGHGRFGRLTKARVDETGAITLRRIP
jgi:hypothetical protein